MTTDATQDRNARIALVLAGYPGDPVTGRFVAEVGAAETLRLVSGTGRLPKGMNTAATRVWREQLRPRLGEAAVRRAVQLADRLEMSVLTPEHLHWPDGLADLGHEAPVVLWARGDTALLLGSHRTRLAVVGARAATGYGQHVAQEIAAGMAEQGTHVVSGGAYGIDAAAHRGAMAAGGVTLAVLAGGLDRYYPSGNQSLLEGIASQGVVLTEVAPGQPPTRHRFLQRNRLIAALSGATLVVEAGVRSGSLNTAGHALRLHRPLAAIPGPVTNPASSGTHRLIQRGDATLVTDVMDMRAVLARSPLRSEPVVAAKGARREGLADPSRFGASRPGASEAPVVRR